KKINVFQDEREKEHWKIDAKDGSLTYTKPKIGKVRCSWTVPPRIGPDGVDISITAELTAQEDLQEIDVTFHINDDKGLVRFDHKSPSDVPNYDRLGLSRSYFLAFDLSARDDSGEPTHAGQIGRAHV